MLGNLKVFCPAQGSCHRRRGACWWWSACCWRGAPVQSRNPKGLLPCAGFLSPASRGALLTALLVVYLLLAVGAGFGSVWLWGMIQRSYEGWTGVTRSMTVLQSVISTWAAASGGPVSKLCRIFRGSMTRVSYRLECWHPLATLVTTFLGLLH